MAGSGAFEEKIRPCGLLSSSTFPQGIDPLGRPIYYCKCGQFITHSYSLLEEHVVDERSRQPKDEISRSRRVEDHLSATTVLFLFLALLLIAATSTSFWNRFQFFSSFWSFFKSIEESGVAVLSITDLPMNKPFLFLLLCFAFFISFHRLKTWYSSSLLLSRETKVRKRREDEERIEKIKNAPSPEPRMKYREEHMRIIEDHAVDYDPTNAHSVQSFRRVAKKSECLFAKKAVIWGSCDWDDDLDIEENVLRSLKELTRCLRDGREKKIDGFVFEIPGIERSGRLDDFAETVRRVLTGISDHDPDCYHCMESESIGRKGWSFTFDSCHIFVTCFGPCYPQNHSRFAHGVVDSCFVLLQPRYSFDLHDIGEEHPWDDTKTTMRQKIRNNFKNAGRLYWVPDVLIYPSAPMIVPPLNIGDPLLKWYEKPKEAKEKSGIFHRVKL